MNDMIDCGLDVQIYIGEEGLMTIRNNMAEMERVE